MISTKDYRGENQIYALRTIPSQDLSFYSMRICSQKNMILDDTQKAQIFGLKIKNMGIWPYFEIFYFEVSRYVPSVCTSKVSFMWSNHIE